ncbi:MAG: precorrin-3B C(17)-methyltransferase [Alphaproteobacteria bacterium]|nr:precorrin-3B C(17)-methyltransferase [Alphaproteobacteria bacterium]
MELSGAAVVILDARQVPLARRIAGVLPGATVHGPAAIEGTADVAYERLATHLAALFREGRPIVGICAAGILIRVLAPHLADKGAEPPVIAVSEDGRNVVPLLGGHHGANRLARDIADALGARAAITTAGDTALGFALDAPPPGWRLGEGARVKAVTAALLAGEPVRLVTEAASADWLTAGSAPFGDGGRLTLHITERSVVLGDDVADVTLHPAVLALGIGCERGCAPDELVLLARRVLTAGGLAPEAVACVASLDLKADEPAVNAVADWLGVPLRLFDAATLERETPRLTAPSEVVFRAVGCHGVAEAAALACAGADGTLAMPKARSERGTCAIARAPAIIEPARVGRGRGRVTVVGIGPGTRAWRTPGADAAIANANDLVGYGRYLDLLGPPPPGCERHAYPIGAEEERCRAALALAAEGRRVALVSSGDAGVYGMASLLFELLDGGDADSGWRGIELAVEPGISALQAAAARAGAPIGHDFCAISLSDLLTPWPAIARRLRAAAEADFVVALYNPASGRRRTQLAEAREILAAHRPLDCPVVVARNLGRDGEQVTVTTLVELDTEAVDMLTVIVVGSKQTRRLEQGGRAWLYTPRGYAPGSAGHLRKAECG